MVNQHMLTHAEDDHEEPWTEMPTRAIDGSAATVIVDGSAMSFRSYRRRDEGGE